MARYDFHEQSVRRDLGVGRSEIVAGTVSPSYLLPLHGLQRLEKIMDEYVGGISTGYMTNEPLFREETHWPGYYYRGDHMKLDDDDWHCFTLSKYHRESNEWEMEKAPVCHIVD